MSAQKNHIIKLTAAAVEIEAIATKTPPRFTALAYTGAPMKIAGYRHQLIVDLAALQPSRVNIPVLRDHQDSRLVGHADDIRIDDQGVHVAGVISGVGEDAIEVVQAAKNGFEWQVSIGADPAGSVVMLPSGKTEKVNSRTIKGPMFIVSKAVFTEISFVARGADGNTSASIAAKQNGAIMSTIETTSVDEAIQAERDRRGRVDTTIESMRGAVSDEILCKFQTEANEGSLSVEELQGKCIEAMHVGREAQERRTQQRESLGYSSLSSLPKSPVAQARNSGPAIHSHTRLPQTGLEAVEAALVIKAGHTGIAEEHWGDEVLDSVGNMYQASVPDILATALRIQGVSVPHSRDEMIRAAVSNHDVQVALSNVGNLSVMAGYRDAPSSIEAVCAIRSADNFQDNTAIRSVHGFDLEPVAPGGDLKHGDASEDTFTYKVDTFGKIFSLDRVNLINDSVGIWNDVAPGLGRAAKRKENDLFVSTLLGATSSYFDSSLGNDTTDAFSVTALAARIAAMREQRYADNDLDLQPATLMVPPALESDAKAALESEYLQRLATDDKGPTGNPLRKALKLVVDSRLSNTAKYGAAATDTLWYLFAQPQSAAMIFAYLQGKKAPTVEFFGLDNNPSTLAVTWRVYHDFGCALTDYKAAQRSTGTGA